jgi:hypothetical protein
VTKLKRLVRLTTRVTACGPLSPPLECCEWKCSDRGAGTETGGLRLARLPWRRCLFPSITANTKALPGEYSDFVRGGEPKTEKEVALRGRDAGETGTEPAAESGVSLRERSEWWDGVRVNPLERGGVTGGGETLSREDLLSVAEAVASGRVALGDDSIADEVSRAVESSSEEEAERGEGWGASASSSRETIREVGGGRRIFPVALQVSSVRMCAGSCSFSSSILS